MATMAGNIGQPFCGSKCCGHKRSGAKHRRQMKRNERNMWRREFRKDLYS